jgi:serine protease Do
MKKSVKKCISAVVLCAVVGSVVGFSIPFAGDYVFPKVSTAMTSAKYSIEDSINSKKDKDSDSDKDSNNDDEIKVDTSDDTTAKAITTMDEGSKNTVQVVKDVKPSIVCITSVVEGTDFFNRVYESEGSGSGIIFYKDSENVYIATNNHVIEGASRVTISINESDLVSASLVGKDSNADLAVISVKLSDLARVGITDVTCATFGDSDKVEVGETVVAIGNALGQGITATKGIVSAQQKNVQIQNKNLSVIQTDAAINPGNSGGALVNSDGQVIGINTAKIAVNSVEGIGYSISSNVAKPIIEQLMNSEDTPALGVYITSITEDVAQKYGLPQAGVLVQQVISGGSAAKAGIKEGDVITSFNDNPTFTTDQLTAAVKETNVGDTAKVIVIRDGKQMTITVKMYKSDSLF